MMDDNYDWCAEHKVYHDCKAMKAHKYEEWSKCVRASNRLMDLVCAMYHPKDAYARKIAPTITWAEIIAEELGIEIPRDQEGG
jgi:hypothetical protein